MRVVMVALLVVVVVIRVFRREVEQFRALAAFGALCKLLFKGQASHDEKLAVVEARALPGGRLVLVGVGAGGHEGFALDPGAGQPLDKRQQGRDGDVNVDFLLPVLAAGGQKKRREGQEGQFRGFTE